MAKYDWDKAKADLNVRKHGISFVEASLAMDDPRMVDEFDDRENYGEDRFIAYAMSEQSMLTIVYTQRGDTIRIISARRATRHEQFHYYHQNASR